MRRISLDSAALFARHFQALSAADPTRRNRLRCPGLRYSSASSAVSSRARTLR